MLINLTPEVSRCMIGACPAVFVKKEVADITPNEYRCIVGACSRVLSGKELVYFVGKKVERVGEFAEIPIGEDEELIALPLGLLKAVKLPE